MGKKDNFEKCCDNCKYYEWYWDKCKKFDCETDARSCCSCHQGIFNLESENRFSAVRDRPGGSSFGGDADDRPVRGVRRSGT